MKVLCITQARMSSTRLPGKVLLEIDSMPLLGYHIARVHQSLRIDLHLIAISEDSADDVLADYLTQQQIPFYRGSEHDVLARFYQATLAAGASLEDQIIRLTGDCPLICPELLDLVITEHVTHNPQGYTHLSLAEYPRGFDTEIFSMKLLTAAHNQTLDAIEREHVTMNLYSHGQYPLYEVRGGDTKWSRFRLCVDQIEDFNLISQLVATFGDKILRADARAICQLLLQQPKLASINQMVRQKTSING